MTYNDKHKQFLQYFMHERVVQQNAAFKLNKKLFPSVDLDDTIKFINTNIAPLEFKINKVVCEQNGEDLYVLVALFVDNFNDRQDPNKVIFGEIVTSIINADGSLPYGELILRYNSQLTEDLIENFFSNKYLITDKNKNIFLSPLAISELEGFLAKNYKNKRCMSCMRFVGQGTKCKSCGQYAHSLCLTEYFKRVGNANCPKCSKTLHIDWKPLDVFSEFQ